MWLVDKVLDNLPSSPVEGVRSLSFLAGLKLIDPDFDQPVKVDLLIGLDSIATANKHVRVE